MEDPSCLGNPQDQRKKRRIPDLPARWVVIIVTFLGFLCSVGLQTTMSIAIVAMVNFTAVKETADLVRLHDISELNVSSDVNGSSSAGGVSWGPGNVTVHLAEEKLIHGLERCGKLAVPTDASGEIKNSTFLGDEVYDVEGEYVWDETAQGAVLGSFYWGYITTQLLGGRLAERFGPKYVLLISILSAGLVTSAIPLVAPLGIQWVIAVRLIQGICQGPTYPIINVVVSRWAITHERSRMIAVLYTGGMMGALVTMYLGGLIIPAFGYASLFYTMTGACFLWGIAFWLLAFDSPAHHPRISRKESALFPVNPTSSNKKVQSVPWKAVLTSSPVWAVILCSMVKGVGVTVMSMMPIYLKAVLGFDMQSSGTYAALPYVGRVTFPIVFSIFIDWLIRKNVLSRTLIRKCSSSLDFFGNAMAYVVVSFAGCDSTLAIAALTVAMACGGASYSGFSACMPELSPRYSGTLGGLTATGFSTASMIIPVGVGFILKGKQNLSRWAIVFRTGAALQVLGGLIFWVLGSAERQSFDQEDLKAAVALNEDEPKPLKEEEAGKDDLDDFDVGIVIEAKPRLLGDGKE